MRRLSSLLGRSVGLADQGTLAVGMAADVVVFEPEAFHDRTMPEMMARHPDGVRHVLVNGRPVVRDGRRTRARPGRVLRRGQSDS